jgi:hypothetical protein
MGWTEFASLEHIDPTKSPKNNATIKNKKNTLAGNQAEPPCVHDKNDIPECIFMRNSCTEIPVEFLHRNSSATEGCRLSPCSLSLSTTSQ